MTVFDRMAHEYDRWFDENDAVYQAEIDVLASFIPSSGVGLEVGVGTGRFASVLDVAFGVDPARETLKLARKRGVVTVQASGEHLPFQEDQFDYALLVTVDPFVSNVPLLLLETWRVLRPEGVVLIGMIDRDSRLGRLYEQEKDSDPFYREAHFHSTAEMFAHLHTTGYTDVKVRQTLIEELRPDADMKDGEGDLESHAYRHLDGSGRGAFLALCATKQPHRA
jgi:ubiquinone/menaquinone biosynthesis C-methylase UbiE